MDRCLNDRWKTVRWDRALGSDDACWKATRSVWEFGPNVLMRETGSDSGGGEQSLCHGVLGRSRSLVMKVERDPPSLSKRIQILDNLAGIASSYHVPDNLSS